MKKSRSSDGSAPYYPCEPIYNISALAKAFGVSERQLLRVAATANQSYRLAAEETKKDGAKRQTFDAYPRLKFVQTRIKERILNRVEYPAYLNGSVRGRSTRINAEAHIGARIAIGEDIANFFPTISPTRVKALWCGIFGFSDEAACLLTCLTVKDDGVPQGAVTSSFIANLIFWENEPSLFREFQRLGYQYTRFVDDITISSKRHLNSREKSAIITAVYRMLHTAGVKPKRQKHEVNTARSRITTTKLVHNARVSLPSEVRQRVRAAVHQLEGRVAFGLNDADLQKELASVSSRVGRLNSFHPAEGGLLKIRLKHIRKNIEKNSFEAKSLQERLHRETVTLSGSSAPP